ncbi:MAG: YceI family protein [Dehalococcoidia bacterium]
MVWVLDPEHTQVGFAAQHLMVATVHGRFTRFDAEVTLDPAQPERSRVTARIDVASLDTGNAERDRHLRSAAFLDVDRFPHIEFTSTQIAQVGPDSFWLRGDLSIHGVTREVTLRGRFDGSVDMLADAPAVRFQMAAEVDRDDFGLTWNNALDAVGILVGRAITITIDAAVQQPDHAPTRD